MLYTLTGKLIAFGENNDDFPLSPEGNQKIFSSIYQNPKNNRVLMCHYGLYISIVATISQMILDVID